MKKNNNWKAIVRKVLSPRNQGILAFIIAAICAVIAISILKG